MLRLLCLWLIFLSIFYQRACNGNVRGGKGRILEPPDEREDGGGTLSMQHNHQQQQRQQLPPLPLCTLGNKTGPPPDVFWINLDRSSARREFMERQLRYYGLLEHASRIRALQPRDVVLSSRLASSSPDECLLLTREEARAIPELTKLPHGRVIIEGLCGRPKNSKRELTVTASHLQALRAAVNSVSSSPYALILEDDMRLGFDIDFHALAVSAPSDFTMLQLITSNDYDVKYLWEVYKNSGGSKLWNSRTDKTDYWCAGAYLINKAKMKPIIDKIVKRVSETGWVAMTVLAGYDRPCFPKYCCIDGNYIIGGGEGSSNSSQEQVQQQRQQPLSQTHPACVLAARGYQADHFVFELGRPFAYMITAPIIAGASSTGNLSTLHQEHVSLHVGAFNRISSYQDEMRQGKFKAPDLLDMRCALQH